MVVFLHQLMSQMEEYFPNPKEFLPERWIKGHPQESKPHPYVMLPFGFGTRMCIGRRLAELEMWQLTAKVTNPFNYTFCCSVKLDLISIVFYLTLDFTKFRD